MKVRVFYFICSMKELNASYWEERYQSAQTGWDIGYPSPALIEYFKRSVPKDASILIPGAGRAYEAEWLLNNEYSKVTIVEWSATAIEQALERAPVLKRAELVVGDFFTHDGQYDCIMEQTFFCALNPSQRPDYAKKMKSLLKPEGVLMGLLFNFPLSEQGPPFGGSEEEYQSLFDKHFEIRSLAIATNSIKPRQGREFFIELIA